jgi:DNA mismatch repair protein MutL
LKEGNRLGAVSLSPRAQSSTLLDKVPERIIHILTEQVASQIAAGEVVERPASALKELLENAIDAGAHNIAVELRKGGAEMISVTDDGCGMGREDAHLALRRHATSKIRDAADLNGVRTMGFRGEALAAIASVSRLRMRTRLPNANEGLELIAEGGELSSIRNCAMAAGTQIEVRDLFFNTPARLKFLKSNATEQASAIEAAQRIALGNYRLAFKLSVDNREILNASRATSALERFRQIYSARLADQMLDFENESHGIRSWGLASSPRESYGSPRLILTYVNQRAVRDRALIRAILQAYQTLLPRGRYPAVALFLELPSGEVDVNVHPMKTEVRFRRSGAVFEMVYHALRERLANQADATPARTESGQPKSTHSPPVLMVAPDVLSQSATGNPVGGARRARYPAMTLSPSARTRSAIRNFAFSDNSSPVISRWKVRTD